MDLKAIVSLLLKLKQYNVLESLPGIVTEFAEILGDVSKKNGYGDKWATVETKLKPHLDKWNQCSKKNGALAAMYVYFDQILFS